MAVLCLAPCRAALVAATVAYHYNNNNHSSCRNVQRRACFVDEQTAFVGTSNNLENNPHITVYRTSDQGKTWTPVQLPRGTDWESGGIAGLFIDFPDASHGYVMATTGPALGQMSKALYKTEDGGKSYSFVKDVTGGTDQQGKFSGIEGYPTGMAFSSVTTGFVTCSYRGQTNPPDLQDGGRRFNVGTCVPADTNAG